MFEPQGPKRLTDVTGGKTFISVYDTPSKQANMMWIDVAGNIPVVFRPGFHSKKRLFTTVFQPRCTPGDRHSAREDNNDQPPLHRNSTARRRGGCPGAATKHGNHTNIVTPWQCCYRQSKGHNSVLPHPPYSPDLAPCDLWLLSTLKTGLDGKKFCEFNTLQERWIPQLHVIPSFWVPQRFPQMAKATATLCGQQRGVLLKIS